MRTTECVAKTMRERMEKHRASPQCASCHRLMDPLGSALENFDAVGAWRTTDAGKPIDTAGQLINGTQVDGVVALREALLKRPEVFVSTVTEGGSVRDALVEERVAVMSVSGALLR